MQTQQFERRAFALDRISITRRAKGGAVIAGHAAVFNQEADLGSFREKILSGAFAETIRNDDVRALFNHDPNFILGRNRSGTLHLREDQRGLFTEIEPPDTQAARDLMTVIDRGDISQMSFGFEVVSQRWETKGGAELRIIEKVKLWDVSPVTFAAYPQTDVALRSLENWRNGQTPRHGFSSGGVESLEPYYRRLAQAQRI